MSRTFERLIHWLVEMIVLIVGFAVAIVLGVVIPGLAAMRLLHAGGWIESDPDAPGVFWAAIRHTFVAAPAIVLGGEILRLGRHLLFVGSYIALLFAYGFIMPLMFSSGVSMLLHAVLSPLFGVDVWLVWRPLLHVASAVGLSVMALKMHFDNRRDFYDSGTGSDHGRPLFRGSMGTGAVAFGEMAGSLTRPSGDSAGGSWSDDSGGGDSD